MVNDIMQNAEERMKKAIAALSDNFGSVRTGRANAMVLDRIKVDYYGVPTPVNQLAGIKTPDAHLLVIEPWDKGSLRAIEHAILESDLGVTPNNDGSVIRLPFPALTEERRRDLVKQCKTYAEEARVAVRNIRRDANAAIERARGKYLQFVDSDDQLDPNATRLLVEAAEETQADLVICNYCSVMPDGKTTVHGFMQPYTRMDKAQFARCLMEEPASFYYGVMWNKLYRREIIMAHDIRCDEEFTWSEDMLFNLSYIRYADSFYAIRTPLYYYARRRKHSLSASVNPAQVVTTKASLFKYYKELYVQLGLYDQYKLQIYSYLVATARDLD